MITPQPIEISPKTELKPCVSQEYLTQFLKQNTKFPSFLRSHLNSCRTCQNTLVEIAKKEDIPKGLLGKEFSEVKEIWGFPEVEKSEKVKGSRKRSPSPFSESTSSVSLTNSERIGEPINKGKGKKLAIGEEPENPTQFGKLRKIFEDHRDRIELVYHVAISISVIQGLYLVIKYVVEK